MDSHKSVVKDFWWETLELRQSQVLEAVAPGGTPVWPRHPPKPNPTGAGCYPLAGSLTQPNLWEAELRALAALIPLIHGRGQQHCAHLLERLPIPAARRGGNTIRKANSSSTESKIFLALITVQTHPTSCCSTVSHSQYSRLTIRDYTSLLSHNLFFMLQHHSDIQSIRPKSVSLRRNKIKVIQQWLICWNV